MVRTAQQGLIRSMRGSPDPVSHLFSTEQMALDVANNKSSLEGNGDVLPQSPPFPSWVVPGFSILSCLLVMKASQGGPVVNHLGSESVIIAVCIVIGKSFHEATVSKLVSPRIVQKSPSL